MKKIFITLLTLASIILSSCGNDDCMTCRRNILEATQVTEFCQDGDNVRASMTTTLAGKETKQDTVLKNITVETIVKLARKEGVTCK